jgi:hypothetical protein
MRNYNALEDEMTTEELKYYTALQPFFSRKTKALLPGDWMKYGTTPPEIIDEDFIRDWYDPETLQIWKDRWIVLPLPIDPRNPERGLWGMIDWARFDVHCGAGKMYLFEDDRFKRELFNTGWSTPTLALLKALAMQEGIGI